MENAVQSCAGDIDIRRHHSLSVGRETDTKQKRAVPVDRAGGADHSCNLRFCREHGHEF